VTFRRTTQLPRLGAAVAALALVATACGGSSGGGSAAGSPSAGTETAASTIVGSASAPITKDSVTVGNVATLSGPIPGLFQGAPYGVDAYFAMVNSQGGVNGRKLALVSSDDALNCNENKTQTDKLVASTFAMVGSFSIYDDCGATVIAAHPQVPDVSVPIGDHAKALANLYSPQPQPAGYALGPFVYFKQKYAATKVGSIYGEGAAATSFKQQSEAMKSVGYQIVYARQAGNTETNFTSDVIRMRSEGVNFLWLTDFNAAGIARVLTAAKQQNWKPKLVVTPTAYDASFFKLIGDPSAAEGLMMPLAFSMFLGEDKAQVPAVATFDTWMHKVHPGFQPDLFSLYGWTSAALFVDALKQAGSDPTPQAVLDALKNTHDFDADGLLAKADVGTKQPSGCWMLATIKSGKFVRVLPDKGFTCDPGGYYRATP
jgi:ABC-type branched-subunit amino acid transport system substrate-binding protein